MPTGAQMRWWFVDRFTRKPDGRRIQVSGERFAALMSRLEVRATVEVADRLGDLQTRTFSVEFERPRTFRLNDLIEASPLLRQLRDLAFNLQRERNLSLAQVSAKVEDIVGQGRLTRLLAGTPSEPAASPSGPSTPASGPSPNPRVDDIFAQAELRAPSLDDEVKSGVDAFVGALLGKRKRPEATAEARASVAEIISAAVVTTAMDILEHPDVASLEASWRGLKMLMGSVPGHDQLSIEIVDADPGDLMAALTWPTSSRERPDAVFIGPALRDLDTVAALAELGERQNTPIVVAIDEGLPFANLDEHGGADLQENWSAFAKTSASQWVCATMNPIVLVHEDTTIGPRLLGGSPAFALAAMFASTFDREAGLRSATGKANALVAPAAHDVTTAHKESRTIPTAYFASVPMQQAAARAGVVLLGSEVGSDRVLVVDTPMVFGPQASLLMRIRQAHAARRASV